MISRQAPPAAPLTLWLIHLAFLTAVPLYAAILLTVLPPPAEASESVAMLIFGAFILLAVVQTAVALTVDRWLKPATPRSGATTLARATTLLILADAFYESIAIYGLVGSFLGLRTWQSLALMGLSLVLLLSQIARLRDWTDQWAAMKRAEEREQD